MKTFRSIAAAFFFTAAIFAVSTFAQTTTQPAGRVGVINTLAFDDKTGITRYVNAMNSLEKEFQPLQTELQQMANKIQALQKELQTLQENANKNPTVPINQASVNAKIEEYDKLGREFKFKQEDAKVRFERREAAVMGPIRQDIGTAMQEFGRQKGYSMILDASKLGEAGLILMFDDKFDATKEFITFYNARPATTATRTQ